jgi:hypothetical protein
MNFLHLVSGFHNHGDFRRENDDIAGELEWTSGTAKLSDRVYLEDSIITLPFWEWRH